jgi:hypothetical protein
MQSRQVKEAPRHWFLWASSFFLVKTSPQFCRCNEASQQPHLEQTEAWSRTERKQSRAGQTGSMTHFAGEGDHVVYYYGPAWAATVQSGATEGFREEVNWAVDGRGVGMALQYGAALSSVDRARERSR